MSLIVRAAVLDDLPQIKHLLLHNNVLRFPAFPVPDHVWRRRLQSNDGACLVAVSDESVVGFTAVEMEKRGAEAWRLAASHPEAEERLLEAAETYVRGQQAPHLTFRLVNPTDTRLMGIFRRRGYWEAEGWPEYERAHLQSAEPPQVEFQPKPIAAADLDAVVAVEQAAFGELAADRAHLEMVLENPAYQLLGIEQEGRVVAFSMSCMLPDGVGYFIKTATEPGRRGAGLAGALCAAVIEDFKRKGATRIWAHTWDSNYRGMHLLEKYAFRRTGRTLVMRVNL